MVRTPQRPGPRTRAAGANIRRWREKRGLSQETVAVRLGYASQNVVTRLESGSRNFTVEQLCAVAEVLGVAPCTLLDGVR